jgi:colicin import membrane protein
MTLYKADFLDLVSAPVKKAGKGKKVAAIEALPVPVETVEVEKVKKPRTEKQLAALEKMKESRKTKKAEAEAAKIAEQEAIVQKQQEVADKEAEIAEKKAAQAEKRRLKRAAGKMDEVQEATPSNTSAEVDEVIEAVMAEPKPKKQRVKKEKSATEPPAWFLKYIEGVNKEQNILNKEKKPAKQLKFESQEVASKSWNDDLTRDRVQQEVDGHMGRMYGMMFGRKLLSQ